MPITAKFNDGTEEFKNQCVAYLSTCPNCGIRFEPEDTVCKSCGTKRPRCLNRAMEGETRCRSHVKARHLALSSKLAATLTDQSVEELLADDNLRDLDEPFLIAKLALGGILDKKDTITDSDRKAIINCVKQFFFIAEKKHSIEQGATLNLAWDDKTVNALRDRIKQYFNTLKLVLDKYIKDDEVKRNILLDLYSSMKQPGNQISVPLDKNDYVESSTANLDSLDLQK